MEFNKNTHQIIEVHFFKHNDFHDHFHVTIEDKQSKKKTKLRLLCTEVKNKYKILIAQHDVSFLSENTENKRCFLCEDYGTKLCESVKEKDFLTILLQHPDVRFQMFRKKFSLKINKNS